MARIVTDLHGDKHALHIDEAVSAVERALPANHPALDAVYKLANDAETLTTFFEQQQSTTFKQAEEESKDAGQAFLLIGDWMRGMLDWCELEEDLRHLISGSRFEDALPR